VIVGSNSLMDTSFRPAAVPGGRAEKYTFSSLSEKETP
jgi:hypothetical protein